MHVLLGQDFGRRHHRHLPAVLDRLQRGSSSDHRLAAAHIALQQALHGMRARKIGANLRNGAMLCGRKLERQRIEKLAHQVTARGQGWRRR